MKLEELLKPVFANGKISTFLNEAMSVLAALTTSAASCEMGFNEVNLIKNELRSLLYNDALNSLLMINVSGPPCEMF
jgi:hypothetical protein